MRLLDRYIMRAVSMGMLLVGLIVMSIEMFMQFLTQAIDLGKAQYDFSAILSYVIMNLPVDLYQLLPIIGFLGSLVGLGWLASQNELVVMRSAGISIIRISWAVIKIATVIILLVTFVGEYWGAPLQASAQQLRRTALHKSTQHTVAGLWLHQGDCFVYVKRMITPKRIRGIERFCFDAHGKMRSASHASSADLINHTWQLNEVSTTVFLPNKTEVKQRSHEAMDYFAPQLVASRASQRDILEPHFVSLRELYLRIKMRTQSGLMAGQMELDFWQRALQPLTSLMMICLAVPFVFGSLRSAGIGRHLLVGFAIGFGFYMLNQFLGSVVVLYNIPAYLAAMTPMMLFFVIYFIVLRRVRRYAG